LRVVLFNGTAEGPADVEVLPIRRRKTAMGKPYSQDLSERVLGAIDDGGDAYEIAPLFHVSVS
jgi:hypothetical protein